MAAVSESLQLALKHHEAGELDQAETLYREIVRGDPRHLDALHLLGVAAHQRSDHQTAADFIGRAIAGGGTSALYHSNLGACYRAMNRIADAIVAFREAVRLEPRFVGGRYNLAMALEAAGSADEAADEYREVLRIEAGFVPAWNNLGSLLSSQGRFEAAAMCLTEAVERSPNSAELRYNLANALSRGGRCGEAVVQYRESIRINPEIPETHNNLATALHALSRHDEALVEVKHSLSLRPEYAEAQANKTAIEQAIRTNAEAAGEPQRARPDIPLPVNASPQAWCAKAAQWQDEGRFAEAADCFRQALALDPNCAAAHFGLGYGYLLAESYEEAATHYEEGLLIDDTNGPAWNNLGSVHAACEEWDEAAACYQSALAIDPAGAKAHFNLGNVHKDLGEPAEASACYRRALYVDPQLAEAHINLGVVLQQLGRLADASASQTRAIEIRPNDPEAHFHRSLTRLLMGDLEQGWDEYEWRWRYDLCPREFAFPVWDGRDPAGKSILVYAEQGVGDEIMFASCLPDVLGDASQCLIECDPRLVPVLARSFPLADVVARPLSVEDCRHYGIDAQIAAGSLPRYFRRRFDSFPRQLRFLAACPIQRAQWNERYRQLGSGLKVGISWRGGGKASTRRRRSTMLEQWAGVLAVPGVRFVNLQYGDCAAELDAAKRSMGVTIHHWPDADPLKDLDGFAAQVAELDLVISVDNATVHMAGALGVPVWTLLHYAPNWRWLLDREDSPWYASMLLVRQPVFGQWEQVFASVAERLQFLATSRTSKSTSQRSTMLARHRTAPPAADIAPAVKPALDTAPAVKLAAAGRIPRVDQFSLDPQAAEERAKYERVWQFGRYRHFSPGAAAIDEGSLVDALKRHGVRTILDAGCGSGKLMWRLMNEFPGEFDVHGFDITNNCLDACFDPIKDRVLTVGCLWNPDDFKTVYDAVICADVMEHIPTERVTAVLANLAKSTRRIAYFSIFLAPDDFGPQLIGEPLHLTVKKPNWWFAKLAAAGFRIESHAIAEASNGAEMQLRAFATV